MNERIKKLRKTLDLTQQKFADRIGSTQNVLANYETGRRNPSSSVINNICKTFNVNEKWLRTGEGEMFLETSDNVLDLLAAKYNLSHDVRTLVEEFVNLKPDIQQSFVDYALKVARSVASEADVFDAVLKSAPTDELPAAPQNQLTELVGKPAEPELAAVIPEGSTPEIEAQVARIREQLIIEASTGTSGASTQARAG